MAAFFSRIGYKATGEWKEEIVFFDPDKDGAGAAAPRLFPDGTPARLVADDDPRGVFADWLIAPKNPWFARSIVNRVWSWLWAAASSTSRTTSGPTIRRAIPNCWPTWSRSWSRRTTT